MNNGHPIIVFSHLRWDFVYQRPQHLLSRLSAQRRIIFVEEPVYDETQPHWELTAPAPNVLVCRPHTPVTAWGFNDEQFPILRSMVPELLREEGLSNYIVWLYTPMALPLVQTLRPEAIIYDCMDELSAFRFAPPQLIERESQLLKVADVVFTGGPSLYRAKLGRHDNLHCFPSSVDVDHFRQAQSLVEPPDQADIPHPRFGFFGVIDERMGLELLDAMALVHPEWHIVMIGPVVKINAAALPQHPNIHYLGMRSYEQLPSYLAGWDVCLLPFARNEATRFISPTKTLEYMAAELPIVSTSIADVAGPYGDIVYLGDTPQAFVAACEQALAAPEQERAARIAKMRQVVAHTSWDNIASAMDSLIGQALRKRSVPLQEAAAR